MRNSGHAMIPGVSAEELKFAIGVACAAATTGASAAGATGATGATGPDRCCRHCARLRVRQRRRLADL